MVEIKDIIDKYDEIKDQAGEGTSDVAVAILVLAYSVRKSATI
jgi:hypothetical protein